LSKTTLEILIPLIKEFEGCSLKAYRCPAGVWTIGWGYTGKAVKDNLVWTQQQADEQLLKTAFNCLQQAINASPILKDCSASKQAATADFIYNLGIGNYLKSTLKLRVDQQNWISAATECKKWNKAKGVVLKGLVKRREKEASLLLKS